jgi:hypothetical protein
MGAGRSVILGGLADHPVGISNEQQVQCVFLILRAMHGEVFQDELVVGDFIHLHLRQVKEGLRGVILIQEVIALVIVDLEVAHIDLQSG